MWNTAITPSPIRLTMWPPRSSIGGSIACGDPAQQLQGGVVAGPQRPGREADQIGEHDGRLGIGRAPRQPLGQGLPHLQAGEAHLARRGVTVGKQPVGRARSGARTALTGRRQRVAEVGIAGQRAAGATDERDQAGTAIGVLEPCADSAARGVRTGDLTGLRALGIHPRQGRGHSDGRAMTDAVAYPTIEINAQVTAVRQHGSRGVTTGAAAAANRRQHTLSSLS